MSAIGKREVDALKWLGVPEEFLQNTEDHVYDVVVEMVNKLKRPITTTELSGRLNMPRRSVFDRLVSLRLAGRVFNVGTKNWAPYPPENKRRANEK